jgi:hypothetical protein
VKIRFISEADEWSTEGAKIATPENLAAIRRVLEDEGPIILEHWFYRGSSSPDRFVFDDFEDFETYLGSKCWRQNRGLEFLDGVYRPDQTCIREMSG